MPGLQDRQYFETTEVLVAENRGSIFYHILGTRWIDSCELDPEPHDHVVVDVAVGMYGALPGMTFNESVEFFYMRLCEQVWYIYQMNDVPEDITWRGHVVFGINMN